MIFDLVLEGVRWFGVNRKIQVTVEDPQLELVGFVAGRRLVSVASARATRSRLSGWNVLGGVLGSQEDEPLKQPLDVEPNKSQMCGASLNFLLDWVRREGFSRILEFGSGVSTVALAREIRLREGRLLSVEQADVYAERTRDLLVRHGLDDIAKIVTAGLTETRLGGVRTDCYGFDQNLKDEIAAFDPDFVVIDGPSQTLWRVPFGCSAEPCAFTCSTNAIRYG